MPTHSLPTYLHQVTRRVLAVRGVTDESRLDLSLANLLTPERFTGIYEAVDIIVDVAKSSGKILIVGDYDADGATSTALALEALSAMGIENTSHLVPDRFEFGYGLSPELVELAQKKYNPSLIITVDNGISSVEGVSRAQQFGIRVVITDHHLPGEVLPDAEAIVNPCLPGNSFESRHLAGVGVVFYLLGAIRARLKKTDWFTRRSIKIPNLGSFVDLVALGTVADLVPLDENNRRLVWAGLKLIKSGRGNKGIAELIKQSGKSLSTLTTEDLAFSVAPRLNAAGRMSNMSLGIDCLTEKDEGKRQLAAKTLSDLNVQRKRIERGVQEEAVQIVDEISSGYRQEKIPVGFCLHQENWHQGVVGIVASRIKEMFYRPAVIFARGKDNELKGSARSIEGLHIRDVLAEVSAKRPGVICRFGGHAMAAGVTLDRVNLEKFRTGFYEILEETLNENLLARTIITDGPLETADFDIALAKELVTVSPWGQGFPEPTFDGVFDIMDSKVVGEEHVRMVLEVPGTNLRLSAIGFNVSDQSWWKKGIRAELVFKLKVNRYRAQESLQLNILYGSVAG